MRHPNADSRPPFRCTENGWERLLLCSSRWEVFFFGLGSDIHFRAGINLAGIDFSGLKDEPEQREQFSEL